MKGRLPKLDVSFYRSERGMKEGKCEIVTKNKRKFPKEMESISVLGSNGILKSIYRCKLCGHKTNRSNNLKTHLQIHKRVVAYKCENCGKRYRKSHGDDKSHLTRMEIVMENIEGQIKKFYRCKICRHTSNRSNNLKKHLKSHESGSDDEFPCDDCGGKCRQSQIVNYHVKEIEVVTTRDGEGKSKKLFCCKICGEKFGRMMNFRSHITSHKPINIFVCKLCGKEYLCEKGLKEHSLSAHGKIDDGDVDDNDNDNDGGGGASLKFPYKCEYCDQLFPEKIICDEHRQIHGGEKPYICTICKSAFRTQSSLYLHAEIHMKNV